MKTIFISRLQFSRSLLENSLRRSSVTGSTSGFQDRDDVCIFKESLFIFHQISDIVLSFIQI